MVNFTPRLPYQQRKSPRYPLDKRLCAQDPIWTQWRRQSLHNPCWESNLGRLARTLVITLAERINPKLKKLEIRGCYTVTQPSKFSINVTLRDPHIQAKTAELFSIDVQIVPPCSVVVGCRRFAFPRCFHLPTTKLHDVTTRKIWT